MHLHLKTAPTVEPVTLDEAKLHLKIDGADDNALITSLIIAARDLAERETSRVFITQTWHLYRDDSPAEFSIPKPPLQSLKSIRMIGKVESYVDENTAKSQPVLKVAATTGFAADDMVIIHRCERREEERVILSIQEDISLTMTENLTYAHTLLQADRVEKYTLVERSRYSVEYGTNKPGRVQLRSGYNWPTHRGFSSFWVEFDAGYGDAGSDVPEALKQAILQLLSHLYENREAEEVPKGLKALFWPFKILRI